MPLADVIIAGGGVIGCSVAYHLGLAGVRTVIVERGHVSAGASGVSAGMLVVPGRPSAADPLFTLGVESLRMFPATLKALHEASGIDPEYITAGTVRLAFTEDDEREARSLAPQLKPFLEAAWVSREDLLETEPRLSQDVRGALYTPGERQVRASRLTLAFAQAAASQGFASFRTGATAVGFTYQGSRVTGVRLPDGSRLTADHVVVAAGAWSASLLADLGVSLPVRPVRGQIVTLRAMPRPLRMNILTGHGYLTPKVDGTLLAGATEEDAGFDVRVTVAGVSSLLDLVSRVAPNLASAEVLALEAGLRPGTPDGLPVLGPVPGWEGISLATGHFRSGIVLSPVTGRLLAELIVQGRSSFDLEPFSLARFD